MNSYEIRQQAARAAWAALEKSDVPVIYVGSSSCGRSAGAGEVLKSVRETIAEHGIKAKVVEVGCIGPCYLEPLMDIALPGGPRVSYANIKPKRARHIVENYLLKGDPRLQYAVGYFGEATGEIAEKLPRFFDLPMLKPQVRVVLRNCGFIDPESIDHYIARDGYAGIVKAFEMGPDWVIDEVGKSGLRGRGGAGFSTATKWRLCREAPGKIKYLICNADEGDPGAFMNRSLIEGDPHAVLEGMLIAAFAIGAGHGYVYIRSEYPLAVARLRKAIGQMREYGFWGKNIEGSGFDFDITIKEGAGAFVCGEETAMIASIEGKRGMPRSKPPFPATSGLFGKPTVINNVETLGTLPNILRNGGEWFGQFGTERSHGTKTFSLVGKVNRTGLIEVPMGMTLRQIIFDVGGGTKKTFKAVQTGGPSGGCLSADFLDTPIDYESLFKAGSIMGSGGLIVMDEDSCVVDVARYFLDFTKNESCGKCPPCRIGTRHLVEILERITQGRGEPGDLEKLQTLGETIKQGSLCGLGQSAPNPVLTTLRYFRPEYEAHAAAHVCPAAVCKELYEYRIIPEECTGCMQCIRVCPTEAITGKKGEVHVLDTTRCVQCRACYDICPFDAIKGESLVESVGGGTANE